MESVVNEVQEVVEVFYRQVKKRTARQLDNRINDWVYLPVARNQVQVKEKVKFYVRGSL